MDKFKMIASVYLLFRQGENILLSRRFNTGYEDDKYGLVAGHVDEGESLLQAAAREAKEEAGVAIQPNHLIFKTAMHRRQNDIRVDFFFEPSEWSGEPTNAEPDKCSGLQWFPVDNLPENTIPYIRQAIECSQKGIPYSEFGWK